MLTSDVVGKNAHVEFYHNVDHRIGVNVTGNGILANMLKKLFMALNQNYTKWFVTGYYFRIRFQEIWNWYGFELKQR